MAALGPLPEQLLFRVLALLGQADRSRALRVNKAWFRVANRPVLWLSAQLPYTADDALVARLCRSRPWVERLKLGASRRISPQAVVAILRSFPKLVVLDLEGTCVALDEACALALEQSGRQLRQLLIGSCRVDNRVLVSVGRIPHLGSLSLSGIDSVDDESLRHLFSGVPPPRFQRLLLSGCANISDAGLALVSASLSHQLQMLSLSYCHKLTDPGLALLASHCPNLVVLSLYGCANVTDASLQVFGERLRRLESLDLSICPLVTDRGLQCLVPAQQPARSPIRELKLYNCTGITDAGLRVLALHYPALRNLSLFGLEHITPRAVKALLEAIPGLRRVDIGGCPMINADALKYFVRAFPHITF